MPTLNDFLALSHVVYQDNPQSEVTVANPAGSDVWERLTVSSDSATGYFGAAYFNTGTKEVILVNRGTNPDFPALLQDVDDDVQMVLGQVPGQFRSAETFYDQVVRLIGTDIRLRGTATLSITGHSLGGSLTQLLVAKHSDAVINGAPLVGQTFNAFGVHGLLNNPEINRPLADYRVTNWVVPSDLVGNMRTHIGTKADLGPNPFSPAYLTVVPGLVLLAYDSHVITNIEKGFNTDNLHPLVIETEEALVKTFVTDFGFPITIDGVAYIGGNNSRNVGNQLTGGGLNDLMFGGRPDDRIHGGDGQDVIYTGSGNDVLWGDGGADFLLGEDGDDTYLVDDANDRVIEVFDGGFDTVGSTATYVLPRYVEQLILQGDEAINGTGNDLDNVLIGNNENNILDGGSGRDSMAGGAGDDTYLVRDLNDLIVEGPGEGTDTVRSFVSYALGANLEKLMLDGNFAVVGRESDDIPVDSLLVHA